MLRMLLYLVLISYAKPINCQIEVLKKLKNLILVNWNTEEKINLDTIMSINGNFYIDTFKISKTIPNSSDVLSLIGQINICSIDEINEVYNLYLELYIKEFSNYKTLNSKIKKYQSILIEFEKIIFNCKYINLGNFSDSMFNKYYAGYILSTNCWMNENISIESLNNQIDSIHSLIGFNKKFIKLLIKQTGFFDIFRKIEKQNIEAFNPYLVKSMQHSKSVVMFNQINIDLNELPGYVEANYFEYYKDYTSLQFQLYLTNNVNKILSRNFVYKWQVIGNTNFANADSLFCNYFLSELNSPKIDIDFENYIYSHSGKERASRLIIQELTKLREQDDKLNYFLALTKTKNAKNYFKKKIENSKKLSEKHSFQQYLDIIEKT